MTTQQNQIRVEVTTDGTPLNTKVLLVREDGQEFDVTDRCQRVAKEADSPVVHVDLVAFAPRDEMGRAFFVSVHKQ